MEKIIQTVLLLYWELSGFDSSSVLFLVLMLKACHQTSLTGMVSVAHYKSPASWCQLAPANYRVVWAVSEGGSSCPIFFHSEDTTKGLTGEREVMGPRFLDDKSPWKCG